MTDVALVVAALFAAGILLALERNLLSILFGLATLSNAANLFVLAMSGTPDGLDSAFVGRGNGVGMVDPLPQALILTAIVIGSALLVYAIFYVRRLSGESGTLDLEALADGSDDEENDGGGDAPAAAGADDTAGEGGRP